VHGEGASGGLLGFETGAGGRLETPEQQRPHLPGLIWQLPCSLGKIVVRH